MTTTPRRRLIALALAAGFGMATIAEAQPQKFGPSGRPLVRRTHGGSGLGGVGTE